MRIDLVVLGFAAMNGTHIECMTKNKEDAFVSTEAGQPLPGEHALAAHNEAIAVGFYQS